HRARTDAARAIAASVADADDHARQVDRDHQADLRSLQAQAHAALVLQFRDADAAGRRRGRRDRRVRALDVAGFLEVVDLADEVRARDADRGAEAHAADAEVVAVVLEVQRAAAAAAADDEARAEDADVDRRVG